MRKFRQGQTIYVVYVDIYSGVPEPRIFTYFLYSHKEPLPEQCCIIERMPVSMMNEIAKLHPLDFFTTSRRKAFTRLKQLERKYGKR